MTETNMYGGQTHADKNVINVYEFIKFLFDAPSGNQFKERRKKLVNDAQRSFVHATFF